MATFDRPPNGVTLTNVLVGPHATGDSDGDDTEQVADIVQAASMAPGMTSVRVYIAASCRTRGTCSGLREVEIFNTMATDNIAKQLSCSWSWSPDDIADNDPIFQEFAAQGQNLFVASGDDGAYTGSNSTDLSYPAEDVYVTAVGGTDLTTRGAGGPWLSETSWNQLPECGASGGGPSDDKLSIPSWQAPVINSSNAGSTQYRTVPDVAAEAECDNYVCAEGACTGTIGGTSFAAPRWAGFLALVNEQAVDNGNSTVGFINPAIYNIGESPGYGDNFHDITSGNNNNGKGQSYNAVVGYDLVTGWGSPNGQDLINALLSDFSLSASPGKVVIFQGDTGQSTIAIVPFSGFPGRVTLSVSGLPRRVTASFSENPTPSTSVLTLNVRGRAAPGVATITVTGTARDRLSASTNIRLRILTPGNFSVKVPPMAIRQGRHATDAIIIRPKDGFNQNVTLTATGLPSGVTAIISPNPATTASTLTLDVANTATVGTSAITVTGVYGSLSQHSTFALKITP